MERAPRLGTDDPVDRQSARRLEGTHGRVGVGTEDAVDRAGAEAVRREELLERDDERTRAPEAEDVAAATAAATDRPNTSDPLTESLV